MVSSAPARGASSSTASPAGEVRILAAVDFTVVIVAGFGFLGTVATVIGQVIVKRLDDAQARAAAHLEAELDAIRKAHGED